MRKSHYHIFYNTLRKIFSDLSVDLDYDPCKPTATDVELWGYDAVKKLYQHEFIKKVTKMKLTDWNAAVAHYKYLLEVKLRPYEATAGFNPP
jgi:hypothetical protein